jgi:sulfide:quinone oxidoreductase
MSQLIELEPGVFVAPQIVASDFAVIAARGIRAVVNNRPDGEAADQMPNAAAQAEAERQGLTYVYQPVPNLNVTDDEVVDAFAASLDQLPRPVLFYCRSGTRCTLLWAQASATRLGVATVIRMAGRAGYDISAIADIIADRASTTSGS